MDSNISPKDENAKEQKEVKDSKEVCEALSDTHCHIQSSSKEEEPISNKPGSVETLPSELTLLPVSHSNLFPGMLYPIVLPETMNSTLEHIHQEHGGFVGIIVSKKPEDHHETLPTTPSPFVEDLRSYKNITKDNFYPYGVLAKVVKKINLPDNQISVLLVGLERCKILDIIPPNTTSDQGEKGCQPHLFSKVSYIFDVIEKGTELEALLRTSLNQFKTISKDNPLISDEVRLALVNIENPSKLVDFMSSVLVRDIKDYQELLALSDVKLRFHYILHLLKKEMEVQNVQKKIVDNINQKISSIQKEYYLEEQLKVIEKELGRYTDEKSKTIEKFKLRLKGKALPKHVKERLDEELDRMKTLHEQSSEYSLLVHYLDVATSLPWSIYSKDNFNLQRAKRILDADHYALKDIKERILEFLAVKKIRSLKDTKKTNTLNKEQPDPLQILCLVGPPGVGKTSLGRSIARTIDRKFYRFSVGGMRDEAEIKGHRRTYIGAMPGKIVQGLRRMGTMNPVFLIDEIDKISTSWTTGGDPSSQLLELFDPEQNKEFLDHYLDLPIDTSKIFFILTANAIDNLPKPLIDRMEIIYVSSYTDREKIIILHRYIIPKQKIKHGLMENDIIFSDKALNFLITRYTKEPGVRGVEKLISKICRKVAYKKAIKGSAFLPSTIKNESSITKLLKDPPFQLEYAQRTNPIGVATGLAWTPYGGSILFIESLLIPSEKTGIKITGTLGKVMQESCEIAHTLIQKIIAKKEKNKNYFLNQLLHIHVPLGATPKDGPSAGITILSSLYSLITKKPHKKGLAMTGEITLTGKILPVGGIKEKVLAAKRAHIQAILLPKENEPDIKKLDRTITEGISFYFVDSVTQALKYIFTS